MPVIEISKKDLEKLVKKKFNEKELVEKAALFVKGEIEEIKGDKIKIELKDTNRPDLLSAEGIARELKGLYGIEKGLPEFRVLKGTKKVRVDSKLEKIRPKAAYAVAKGVEVKEEVLEQLIQLQEKLCETFGRKRKEIAIGVFDYDKIEGNLQYYAASHKTKFVPLGFSNKMELKEILEVHQKGIEYGHLVKKHEKYPLLVDEKQNVLSMPPVINSEHSGKVTSKTKNLFIDVTGQKQETVNAALRVIAAALYDRGARIESVEIEYGKKKIITPEMREKSINVPLALLKEISGECLEKKAEKLALMKRLECRIKGKTMLVKYPAYRADVLHAVDIIEDLLVAMDYNALKPLKIEIPSKGTELKSEKEIKIVREACIGLGLQEIATFILTSKEKQQEKALLPEQEFVEIANPLSSEGQVFRKSLIPEALAFLSENQHCSYPQKIFETGKTVKKETKNETCAEEKNVLCIALCHQKTDFNEAKAFLDAVCRAMGWENEVRKADHPSFKKGRCAQVKIGSKRGVVGEISEKTLSNFGLSVPVTVIEIEL